MKLYVYADCSNLYYTAIKRWGRKLDYRAVDRYLAELGDLTIKRAYGSQLKDEAKGFITALESSGWECIFKTPKTYSDGEGGIKRKSDWDVGMAVDMLEAHPVGGDGMIVLLSADGDMCPALSVLRERGYMIVVMGFGVSGEITAYADSVIEIPPSLLEEERHER